MFFVVFNVIFIIKTTFNAHAIINQKQLTRTSMITSLGRKWRRHFVIVRLSMQGCSLPTQILWSSEAGYTPAPCICLDKYVMNQVPQYEKVTLNIFAQPLLTKVSLSSRIQIQDGSDRTRTRRCFGCRKLRRMFKISFAVEWFDK